jgi:prepilin-type N-terminal cleavage/methylation domain-containing protein
MEKKNQKKPAFTLIELLVVIAIIGVLATLVIVVFSGTRAGSRDSARLSDVNRIRTALDLYWQSAGVYPSSVVAGASIEHNGNVFMQPVPFPPLPTDDGDCPDLTAEGEELEYTYTPVGSGGNMSYTIEFCLGSGGDYTATPYGIVEVVE